MTTSYNINTLFPQSNTVVSGTWNFTDGTNAVNLGINYELRKIGNTVFGSLSGTSQTGLGSSVSMTETTGVPAVLQPIVDYIIPIQIIEDSVSKTGLFQVESDGDVILFSDTDGSVGSTRFTNNITTYTQTVHWNVAQ